MTSGVRTIVIIWLCWALTLIGFQAVVDARFQPQYPDRVLSWTESETARTSQDDQPYLVQPYLNAHVSWDSEFYLSIAAAGYDDPLVRTAPPSWRPDVIHEPVSLNYAFFPLYPFLMRVLYFPLRLVMVPALALTLSGVLVSLLGALGAMLAIYDLTHEELAEHGAIRAAFYLIVFPTGFFLAQVYTEGLFVGLAFGSLALLRRKRWVWAAVLAACATWTRAVGGALIIPLVLAWVQETDWKTLSAKPFPWQVIGRGLLALSPSGAYLLWRVFFGEPFHFVEETFFGRGAFLFSTSFTGWLGALSSMWLSGNPQTTVYYAIEFAAMLLAVIAMALTVRQYPGLTLFGLAVFAISLTSGVPQGMHRYVLGVPSIFIQLGRWGRHETFDRAWTIGSILLMGLLATLFTFDMWVA